MTGDLPIAELLPVMDRLLGQGADCYLKWDCPRCGERVTANDPNTFHTRGYAHEEKRDGSPCGGVYDGTRFGFIAVWAPRPEVTT